jgi:hypothetical protein
VRRYVYVPALAGVVRAVKPELAIPIRAGALGRAGEAGNHRKLRVLILHVVSKQTIRSVAALARAGDPGL